MPLRVFIASLAITVVGLSFARLISRASRAYAPEYRYRPRVRVQETLPDRLRNGGGL